MEPFAPQSWEMPPGARVLEERASVVAREFDGSALNLSAKEKANDNYKINGARENWRIAREINRETRANPDSPYTGKFVGVWNEEVVTVSDSLEEACEAVKDLGDSAASECCVIEANADYDAKIMFWGWS